MSEADELRERIAELERLILKMGDRMLTMSRHLSLLAERRKGSTNERSKSGQPR